MVDGTFPLKVSLGNVCALVGGLLDLLGLPRSECFVLSWGREGRGTAGWARCTGTWCRVEIGVRQVEGTNHVAFYALAVGSMERANHQQRPLASRYTLPPPHLIHTLTHCPLN